jgi:hypothetical protein
MGQSLKIKYNISQWDKLKINYWGIPKSGNTSVKYALLKTCNKSIQNIDDTSIWVHENNLAVYIDQITAAKNGYTNITVTRNPYERAISMYKDTIRRKDTIFATHHKNHNISSFDSFLDILINQPDDKRNLHFKTQTYFITKDSKLLVDEVYDLNDIPKINKRLGISIPHINNINGEIELTGEQIKKINIIYEADFRILKYNMK